MISMRILYIEDNADDALLVNRYVRTTPHELIIVETMDAARSMLETKVDLFLVDLMLNQQRTGLEIARALRQSHPNIPVVAVTALTTANDLAQARAAGFHEILVKPFQIGDLADLIQRYTQ